MTEDSNINKIIFLYLSDQADLEDISALREWIKSDPGHKQEFENISNYWKSTKILLNARNMDDAYDLLQKRIDFRHRPKLNHYGNGPRKGIILFLRVAAVAAMLVLAFTWYFSSKNLVESKETLLIIRENTQGQKLTVKLPDGSMVKLNADSKILYPENFDGDTRDVTLYGEAFFEVVKNEPKPFVIRTKDIHVQVLGTSFNVKSYPGKESTVVSVASGKVAITDSNHQRIDLLPGEKLSYHSDSRSMIKGSYEWEEEFGWKENILLYRESTFTEIMERLSKWYGVEFVIDGDEPHSSKKISGRYTDPTIKAVLEGLLYVFDFSYEIDNKTILINFKQKNGNGQ